jgi:hypothetical protein
LYPRGNKQAQHKSKEIYLDFKLGGCPPCPGGGPFGFLNPLPLMQLSIACILGCPLLSFPAELAHADKADSIAALSVVLLEEEASVLETVSAAAKASRQKEQPRTIKKNDFFIQASY